MICQLCGLAHRMLIIWASGEKRCFDCASISPASIRQEPGPVSDPNRWDLNLGDQDFLSESGISYE
jgi:hypothetical protein